MSNRSKVVSKSILKTGDVQVEESKYRYITRICNSFTASG